MPPSVRAAVAPTVKDHHIRGTPEKNAPSGMWMIMVGIVGLTAIAAFVCMIIFALAALGGL